MIIMNKKIELIGNFASDWIRYSDYEYKITEEDELYIIPTEDAVFTMYNPFDVADDIIVDIIRIGQEALQDISKETKEMKLKKEILEFVKKYGLLGLIYSSVYNRDIVGEERVLMIEKNYITKENILSTDEYVNMFIPFASDEDVYFKKYRRGIDVSKREESPKFFGKRPLILDLVFSKFYTEQLDWIVSFAKDMCKHFNQICVYKNTSNLLTESVTIMSGGFNPQKIGFSISQLDKPIIAWEFDSLKTAIETIYAFAITSEPSSLNKCKYCGKIYIPTNSKSQYCSPSCRNCSNVKKSRSRAKKDK